MQGNFNSIPGVLPSIIQSAQNNEIKKIPKLCNTKYKAFKLRNPSVILGLAVDSIDQVVGCCDGELFLLPRLSRDIIKHSERSKTQNKT